MNRNAIPTSVSRDKELEKSPGSEPESGLWNSRTLRLIGEQGVESLARAHILVVGVGGVGGYVAEMLARSGVGQLTLVDSDTVSESNLNRQIIALRRDIGRPKVQLMAERIAEINPECKVTAIREFVTTENVEEILAGGYDFVADCIDSVAPKVALLHSCKVNRIAVISSMGAGGRLDPTQICYADLWETKQDGLARAVRDAFKRIGYRPSIPVVYSPEAPKTSSLVWEEGKQNKRSSYGTLATIPSVFGIYMASFIISKCSR